MLVVWLSSRDSLFPLRKQRLRGDFTRCCSGLGDRPCSQLGAVSLTLLTVSWCGGCFSLPPVFDDSLSSVFVLEELLVPLTRGSEVTKDIHYHLADIIPLKLMSCSVKS